MIISTPGWVLTDPLFFFWGRQAPQVVRGKSLWIPCEGESLNDMSTAGAPGGPISTTRFLTETGIAATVASLVEPAIEDLGFRLVRIKIGGAGDGSEALNLQIMCERPDGQMTVGECETVSRQISPLLDANEPIAAAYRLEISSPGIDRPLVRPSDFEDWAGHEARLELAEPVNGRKRFRGMLEGFEDGEVRIACDLDELGVQVLGFKPQLIGEARLVLTDDLIRETLQRSKKALAEDKSKAKARRNPKPKPAPKTAAKSHVPTGPAPQLPPEAED